MHRYQQILNVVWIVLGSAVAVYATRLGVWQAGGPASGFMPLAAGALIASLGCLQLVLERAGAGDRPAPFFPSQDAARRILAVVAVLIAIALLMERLGFLLTSFLAMTFLLTIVERRSWLSTLSIAAVACGGAWWLFGKLDLILPPGPFGF